MKNVKIGIAFLAGVLSLVMGLLSPSGAEDISVMSLIDLSQEPIYSSESFSAYTKGEFAGAQEFNWVNLIGNTIYEENSESISEIGGSVNRNSGIINLNQASGTLNIQSNQRVFSLPSVPSAVEQIQLEKSVVMESNEIHSTGATRQDLIRDSLHDNTGVVGINQAAGNLNSQSNTLVMIIGGVVSLTDMEMGDVRSSNTLLNEEQGNLTDMIKESLENTSGIFQITQSAGDMNIQGNNMSFSYREIYLR